MHTAVARGVVTPHGIVLTVRGIVLTDRGMVVADRGTEAVRGIEAARGVVMRHGIVLAARGMAVAGRGTGAVHGIEAGHGVVMHRGIALTARGTVLMARGTTVADVVAVASAHSTGKHPCPPPDFVAWRGRIGVASATMIESVAISTGGSSLRHKQPQNAKRPTRRLA